MISIKDILIVIVVMSYSWEKLKSCSMYEMTMFLNAVVFVLVTVGLIDKILDIIMGRHQAQKTIPTQEKKELYAHNNNQYIYRITNDNPQQRN
jgi:hypothetical protein